MGEQKIQGESIYRTANKWGEDIARAVHRGRRQYGFLFASLNIASVNVTGTASTINLGNTYTQPFSGIFTRTDGSSGDSGIAQLSGSLLLASNTFYSQFTDAIPLTNLAKTLPGMSGSGLVRDLREAENDGMWARAA